jgi:2-methylcitrate dehydratase PrpD
MLKLDFDRTRNAVAIAEMHAPVPRLGRSSAGATIKEAVPWGAFAGVHAALLAESGVTGPGTIFDGQEGAVAAPSIDAVYFKRYCGCRFSHAALDALGEILFAHTLGAGDLKRIVVGTFRGAAKLGERRPHTIEGAQFSVPYLLGALAVHGEVSPEQMREEALADPALHAVADRVELGIDSECDARRFSAFGALVTVETISGAWHQRRLAAPRGESSAPMSDRELRTKYDRWVTPVLGANRAAALADVVNRCESLERASDLAQLLR